MIYLLCTLTLLIACAPRLPLQQEQRYVNLLARRDYFALRAEMARVGKALPRQQRLYYGAYLENAFNQPAASIQTANQLLLNRKGKLRPETASNLLILQIDNYAKTFDYARAHEVSQLLLQRYASVLDSSYLASIANSDQIWAALTAVPPQQILFDEASSIPWKRDKMGLMTVPVRAGLETMDFIFDTGANFSTISETYARKMGMEILDASLDVGSSTGTMVRSRIGVADAFRMGNMLIQHAVFLVLPDEQLSFPQYKYAINGIIGFPVIEQMKEVHILKNGTITVPAAPHDASLRNLALHELMPMVLLASDRDTLIYHLDTGAKQTALFSPYYEKYRAELEQQGAPDTVHVGGAGGMVATPVYTIDSLSLYIGSHEARLKRVKVQTQRLDNFGDIFSGHIGQDVIRQFDEMILNFVYMYLDFAIQGE